MFSSLFSRCLGGREDDSSEDECSDQSAASTVETYTGPESEWIRFSAGAVDNSPMDEAAADVTEGGPSVEAVPSNNANNTQSATNLGVASNEAFRPNTGVAPHMNAAGAYNYQPNMMNQSRAPYGSPYNMGGYSNGATPSYGAHPSMMMHQQMAPQMMPSRSRFPVTNGVTPVLKTRDLIYDPTDPYAGANGYRRNGTYPYGLPCEKFRGDQKDVMTDPICSYVPSWSENNLTTYFRAFPMGFEPFKKMEGITVDMIRPIQTVTRVMAGNNFKICNKKGKPFFFVSEYRGLVEENDTYRRIMNLRCLDIADREVATLRRDEYPKGCCGTGMASNVWLTCDAKLGRILDLEEELMILEGLGQFAITIACNRAKIFMDENGRATSFDITDCKGNLIGAVVRQIINGNITYRLEIPVKLHVQYKVLLMFATILLYYRNFEDKR